MDLYDRINVLASYLAPLRDRIQDTLPLAQGAVARSCQKFDKQELAIGAETRAALEAYHWPGNNRQLETRRSRSTT